MIYYSVMKVSNHRLGAILTSIFCFQVVGLIALVYAGKVDALLAKGDVEGARVASRAACRLVVINICVCATIVAVGLTAATAYLVLSGLKG